MPIFKKAKLSQSALVDALNTVKTPGNQQSLHDSGRVSGLTTKPDGAISFVVEIDPEQVEAWERCRIEAEQSLQSLPGVTDVSIVLTAERPSGATSSPADHPPTLQTQRVRKGARMSDSAQPAIASRKSELAPIDGIDRIVAVTSAKGGVGKSTIAVNLAVALSKLGLRVGLLDADVYGPSVPTMVGTADEKPDTNAEKKLVPIERFGVKTMSIGYVADVDAPMVWRGPIVMSAIMQMLNDVAWGGLDILLIDTPPGTGDAQLTLAQRIPLNGAIIVSTPQEVALADVRRGAAMFQKTQVPVLGIVENMAYFAMPDGSKAPIFGEGGARRMAETLELPFLGEVPIEQVIREGGDAGVPVTATDSHPALQALAEAVLTSLDEVKPHDAPTIIFDDD